MKGRHYLNGATFQETGPVGVAKNLTLEDLAEIMPDVATTLQVPVHTLTKKT